MNPNIDEFEAYFKRADLDGDGRISGAEAVEFFQGSGLPKQVLAKVWSYSDRSRSGFLDRQNFFDSLRLVTVAQSKRDLTPEVVNAALNSPVAAEIPPPKINLSVIPAPRHNPADHTQVVPVSSTVPQKLVFGAPGIPNRAKSLRSSSSSSNAKTYADSKLIPPQIQVFINFRGVQLRSNFVGYLVHALRRNEVNVFIDNHEQRGEDLNTLFKRIEDSAIAIVVFSTRYTESSWCLEELVKIQERAHQGLLKVLPIFYKVSPADVKRLKGEFGDHFRDKEYMYESDESKIKRWKEAILFVSHKFALVYDEKSGALEIDFVETIVKEVLEILQSFSTVETGQSSR